MTADASRNPDLDGLRGLAALSVALGHCYEQVIGMELWVTSAKDFHAMSTPHLVARLLAAFFPSDAAVLIFFVLSGHVLWGSFRRRNLRFFRDLPEYTSSRLYRLLPLTIVTAIPLGFVTAAPAAELVQNMLLFSHSVNGVLWSLQVEMVASAMLFLLWGLTKGSAWKLLAALLLAIVAMRYCNSNPLILFLPAFILGAGIASVPAWIFRNTWLLAAAVAVLLFASLLLAHSGVDRCLEMGAATMLVGAAGQRRLPFLHGRIPLFLGAISYPFYLTHLLGLIIAQPMLNTLSFSSPYPMIAARAALSIPPTILIAWLLHVLVELPVHRGRPRIVWPFTIEWSAKLRRLIHRPLQADVPAVATSAPVSRRI